MGYFPQQILRMSHHGNPCFNVMAMACPGSIWDTVPPGACMTSRRVESAAYSFPLWLNDTIGLFKALQACTTPVSTVKTNLAFTNAAATSMNCRGLKGTAPGNFAQSSRTNSRSLGTPLTRMGSPASPQLWTYFA